MTIVINLGKAKEIAHCFRREAREKEFSPLDEMLSKQLPNSEPLELERMRQEIRDKYKAIQESIDKAETPEEIKLAIGI